MNKIPPEFEWIKPGVKVKFNDCEACNQIYQVETYPEFVTAYDAWLVRLIGSQGRFACEALQPFSGKITLTLTRHQAQALLLQMQKLDGVSRGFIEDEKFYREIEKQIEEKLK